MAIEARENLIEDGMVTALKRIDRGADASLWATKPMTIDRGFLIASANAPRPALLVQIASWESSAMIGPGHDNHILIAVHIIVELSDASKLLHLVARDVRLAVARDETLGGNVEYCYPKSYQPQVEAMDRMGFAVATVSFEARYVWNHSAP